MTTKPRQSSPVGLYHVTSRGCGRRLIFDGDNDRCRFLELLRIAQTRTSCAMLSWALMDNHVHLVLEDPEDELKRFAHWVLSVYAQGFNRIAGHEGSVFQHPFHSEPILNDGHLACCIRYVNQNPWRAGLATGPDHPWVSYRALLAQDPLVDSRRVVELFGTRDELTRYLGQLDLERPVPRPRVPDQAAREEVCRFYGPSFLEFGGLGPAERDKRLRAVLLLGLSLRQTERLTGTGRKVVRRVAARMGVAVPGTKHP